MPHAHHGKAWKQIDTGILGRGGKQSHHALDLGLADDTRRELRVHQHDVGANRLELTDALANERTRRRERVIAQHRIGAELPQHEVGFLRDHAGLETGQHVAHFLAIDAMIDDADAIVRKALPEFGGEAAGIGCIW